MGIGGQLLLFCAILLQLLRCSSGRSGSGQFETAALCPKASALPSRNETTKLRCAAACRITSDCDLFHFNKTTGLCYHGNSTCEGLALWSEGPCQSYRAAARQSAAEPIVNQLSLKLLYKFATRGLENVADPCKHRLWSGTDTVLDSEGAHFVKSSSSFLMAETPGFENVVNKGNKFSFFVRAKHPLDIDGTYAAFRQCSGENVAHDFYTDSRNTWHQVFWPADGKYYLYKSGDVFSKSSSVAQISTGVSYDTDHSVSFFFNGSVHDAALDDDKSASDLNSDNFQCLQLGGFPGSGGADATYSIRGSISCFGLSTRLLTRQEFVLLDSWCQQG